MKETLSSRLNKIKLQEIIDEVAHNNPQVMYPSGPLNKSEETQLFEVIVKDLLLDAREGNSNRVKLEVRDNETFLIREETNIKLNELLSKVNFNHLNFSEQDISDYSQYVGSKIDLTTPQAYSQLLNLAHMRGDITDSEKESTEQLSHGEKQAIAIYIGKDYTTINGVLRGQIITQKIAPELALKSLLHAAIATQGLNKLPDVELPRVVRIQDDYNIKQLIENATQHKVSQESAFISTSDKFSKSATKSFPGNVRIVYENVKGKKIAGISQMPRESEYLLPPSTQIKWTGHREENGVHYFTVQGANVLMEQMEPAERVKIAIEQIDNYVNKVSNLIINKEKLSSDLNKPASTSQSVAEPLLKSKSVNTPISKSDHKQEPLLTSAPEHESELTPLIPQPKEFIYQVVSIVEDNQLTHENNLREYTLHNAETKSNSNFHYDTQQFTKSIDNSFLSVKTKLYNLVGNIITHLGLKSLGAYFTDKACAIQKHEMNDKKSNKIINADQQDTQPTDKQNQSNNSTTHLR